VSIRDLFRASIANLFSAFAAGLNQFATGLNRWAMATIRTEIRDNQKGWTSLRSLPNDRDFSEAAQLYRDALEATRKNPMAKAVIDITTDFVLGDGIVIASPHGRMQAFLEKFWHHELNRMDLRLQSISDELGRAGDLFVALFRNDQDGMSYVRFVTKEQIVEIETAENDWETEIAYYQVTDDPTNPKQWLSPRHPDAAEAPAVMLHYSVNRPIGASFGDGDLDTVIPWLLRYSRMLEDRVRMHWAVRSFLWFVTVPTSKVESKKAEYAVPPEAGSIVVKDDGEEWDVKTPTLRASDAKWDLQAVRHMIDSVGYPPHWRGEGGDANLATATAMQLRPERHLRRRQNYIVFILQDICYQAFLRQVQIGKGGGGAPRTPFNRLFVSNVSDISRQDNTNLATAANQLSIALQTLFQQVPAEKSTTLTKLAMRLIFKFAGEPQDDTVLNAILRESGRTVEDIDDAALNVGPGMRAVKLESTQLTKNGSKLYRES